MNPDDNQDRLVELLLSELVGKDVLPDVRGRVMEAADQLPLAVEGKRRVSPKLVPLRSARRSNAMSFAIAAMVTLLGVAGVILHFQRVSVARTPVLSKISGTVDRSLGVIPPGNRVSTGPQSSAVLTYPDGTLIELDPETSIVVVERSPWDWSKGIEIVAGGLKADVAPQKRGSPLVLRSSDARAEVVGTSLSFDLTDDRTRLEVMEGAVQFVPRKVGRVVLVEAGYFAESGRTGFRHERIPVPPVRGITGFTLMNAETDRPIRNQPLVDGETISLSALPTREINIRADYEGAPPTSVIIDVKRHYGYPTGLPSSASGSHNYPPFFIAGDHWADGRPNDCAAWTPPTGLYHLSAQAIYANGGDDALTPPLKIKISITE